VSLDQAVGLSLGLELGSGCIKSTIAVDDNAAAAATFAYVIGVATNKCLCFTAATCQQLPPIMVMRANSSHLQPMRETVGRLKSTGYQLTSELMTLGSTSLRPVHRVRDIVASTGKVMLPRL